MSITAVIFDCFGVLCADEYGLWLAAHGIERAGDYATASIATDLGKATMDDFLARLSELSKIPADSIRREFKLNAQINPQVVEIIESLKGKVKVVLLSNSASDWIREVLSDNQLESLFDEIIISSEVGMIKPQPEIYQLALDRLKMSAEQTAFIDDKPINVEAALALGIHALHYESPGQVSEFLHSLGVNVG